VSARAFPWPVYWVLFALIGVFAMLPILVTIFAAAVANAYGCSVTEGVAAPCMIGGEDWGTMLQFSGLAILYIFLTWPVAFVLFLIWLIVLLVHRSRARRSAA
jgi:hypothetical protein